MCRYYFEYDFFFIRLSAYFTTSHFSALVWELRAEGAGTKSAPSSIRHHLAASEHDAFRAHAAALHLYNSRFNDVVDLLLPTHQPPKSPYITVRALKDVSFDTHLGDQVTIVSGAQMLVRQTDVEHYIAKGHLLHVT